MGVTCSLSVTECQQGAIKLLVTVFILSIVLLVPVRAPQGLLKASCGVLVELGMCWESL
jgi:hypothetical protein